MEKCGIIVKISIKGGVKFTLGKIIVIEGTDSSGKATQAELLYESLKKDNNVKKLAFPDYESDSSALIKMYLNGDFGKTADSVSSEIASIFYASDRYASFKTKWQEFYNKENSIIVLDRYVTSNMVHQAAKIDDLSKKEKYLEWVYNLEYEIFGLPKPDMVIFLNMPPEKAALLMADRPNKITNDAKKDIHESDLVYLKKCYENALFVSKKYNWHEISCVNGRAIKPIEEIHGEIRKMII